MPVTAPKDLIGRFLKHGEIVKEGDLVDFLGFGQSSSRWRKTPYWDKEYKKSCLYSFYRAAERAVFDASGVYICPYVDKEATKIDRAPKGLRGRFLVEGETVQKNDLTDEAGIFSLDENTPPKWKRVVCGGFRVILAQYYFKPSENQTYSVDNNGYYVPDECPEIIDIEEIEEIIKPVSENAKLILHNDFS